MNKEEVSEVLERKTGYHVLTDRSLKSQTKDRLVWLVRILEHNWANAELSLSQQAENFKDWEPVKHGHWVKVRWVETPLQPDEGYWIVRCSACHIPTCSTFRYCPHCGAKMDEEET